MVVQVGVTNLKQARIFFLGRELHGSCQFSEKTTEAKKISWRASKKILLVGTLVFLAESDKYF